MKRLLICLLLLCTFLLPAPVNSNSFDFITQSVRPLTIDGRTVCTSTSVNEQYAFYLTAAHCVTEPVQIDGHDTTVVFISREADLAVLHTPGQPGIPARPMATVAPQVGDRVHMHGYPLGLPLQYFSGHVASLSTELVEDGQPLGSWMLFQLEICGGNSGSAILNDRGEVVSVAQIGWGRPCTGFSGGATWSQFQLVARYFEQLD